MIFLSHPLYPMNQRPPKNKGLTIEFDGLLLLRARVEILQSTFFASALKNRVWTSIRIVLLKLLNIFNSLVNQLPILFFGMKEKHSTPTALILYACFEKRRQSQREIHEQPILHIHFLCCCSALKNRIGTRIGTTLLKLLNISNGLVIPLPILFFVIEENSTPTAIS